MSDERPNAEQLADERAVETPVGGDGSFESRLTTAWDCARRSELEQAYQELQTLGREFPDRADPYLGRYWLLRLNSKLDPDRKPCDELFECLIGLRAGAAAALELYRREIERTPEESLSDRSTRLLRESPVDGGAIVLAHARWQEASHQAHWELIRDDLAALRATPVGSDPETRRRLLRSAMEASVWDSQPESAEIYEACAGELRPRAGDEGEPPSASFVEVADEVRRLRVRNIPPAFLRIVVHSWSASPAELYLQLVTFFSTWVDNHGPLIRMLDDVRDAGGAVLGRFREVLRIVARELGRDVANPGDAEAIAPVVADFLAGPVGRHYDAHFRISLLRFRLYQRICVETFADAARRDPHAAIPDGHLAELAAADVPLECAYEALRLIDA